MEPPPDLTGWELFARPDFLLRFHYPAVTPQGRPVDRIEEQRGDAVRVHLTSPGSQELYVEVICFPDLAPAEEYRRHRLYLDQRDEADATITELRAASLGQSPAQAYDFRVGERERSALLLQIGRDAYPIIYDPRFPLNAQVVATVTIVG